MTDEFRTGEIVDIDWGVHVISARVMLSYGEAPHKMVTMELTPDLSSCVVDKPTTLTLPEDEVRHRAAVA